VKPPATFRLSAKTWTIKQDDRLDDDGEVGNHHGYRCAITYSEQPDAQQLRDIIWHEILHALMYETGLGFEMKDSPEDVTEERVVRAMATASLALLRDNPRIARFLLENTMAKKPAKGKRPTKQPNRTPNKPAKGKGKGKGK
jgi:hypothetical protein